MNSSSYESNLTSVSLSSFYVITLCAYIDTSLTLFLFCFNCTDSEEKTTHVRFLLSNAEAGSVIGKGGSTINDIQSQSGARIQLSRNYEYFPGTNDRVVMVSGRVDDILKAVDLIMIKLLDEVRTVLICIWR